jgi:hypothetical protein
LTDLASVYFGMGVFLANTRWRNENHIKNMPSVFSFRQDYMTSRMFSYALALFAYARGETEPAWARYLRPHAAETFKGGLRYLHKTSDTLFHAGNANQPINRPTEVEAIQRLTASLATVRVATLRDIAAFDPRPVALVDAMMQCLNHRDIAVQVEAARALALFGAAAHDAVPDLIRCLASKSAILRANAAAALPAIGGPAPQVVPELTRLLQDSSPDVVDAAAEGLRQYASSAATVIPALVEALRYSEITCRSSDIPAAAIVAIDPPAEVLQALLNPIDREIRKLMNRSLRAAKQEKEEN